MKRTTMWMLAAVTALVVALQPALASASVTSSWLDHLNSVRFLAGLAPVSENAEWSAGCYAHARYTSLNRVLAHSEDPSLPHYSDAGNLAARRSNVALGAGGNQAIDLWVAGPFHSIGMLDPDLRTVGFGTYSASGALPAAALDVIRGSGSPIAGTMFPVMWPGPGSVSRYLSYKNNEYPDPLAGTGFSKPAGAPIIVQFGAGDLAPVVTASSLRTGGLELAHAVYSELTYQNPNASAQTLGRSVLGSRDAVVLMPKAPLVPGTRYDVSLTVNGQDYQWSFSTQGPVDIAVSAPPSCGYEGPATVSARLTAEDGSLLDDRAVRFESSTDGRTWSEIQTHQTTDGAAAFSVSPVRRIFVRAAFDGDGTLPACVSAPVSIVPAAKVGRPAMPSRTCCGRTVTSTGSLLPRHTAGRTAVRVYAQRYQRGRWVTRATFRGVTTSTGYGYRARIKLPYRGTWRLRSVHLTDTQNARKASAWRRVVVK